MKTLIGGLAMVVLASCVPRDMPQPSEGQALFAANCVICHGPAGRGDGPLADGLDPPPADLTGIVGRNGGQFPATQVLSAIDGYARTPVSTAGMPEFGLLLRGPIVPVESGAGPLTPTPRPLAALLTYLESIQRPSSP